MFSLPFVCQQRGKDSSGLSWVPPTLGHLRYIFITINLPKLCTHGIEKIFQREDFPIIICSANEIMNLNAFFELKKKPLYKGIVLILLINEYI